ncbi:Leucine-rich repeat-containing protein 14 [Pristimantis euphronides]
MLPLVFLCSRQLVSDHGSLRRALPLIPEELYPALFRAAFLDKRPLVLQDLVQRWPFPVLSLQRLLQDDTRHPVQLYQKANRQCVQTIIMGVMAYLRGQIEGPPLRKQRLQLLDMTGSHDDGLEQGPDTLSLWARTVTLAKSCINIAKRRQSEETIQVLKRRKGEEKAAPSPAAADPSSICVEVRVDLFVNSTSFSVVREALQVGSHGPLRLQCRDIRAEELSLRSTVRLLELLNPSSLRQIDLTFNNLGLTGLNALLPHVTCFSHLLSLKLPYSNIDVRRLLPAAEEDMQKFASQICQLSALKELNLGSSRISGRLQQLLRGLRTPLESLELAYCYLLPADLHYLCQSIHVSCLKKLDLSGNSLCDILFQPFLQLLDAVSSSLLLLDLVECKLRDSALSVLTPALGRCRSLRYLGLFCNPFSGQGIHTLLQISLHLADLRLVIYPFPVECYMDASVWPDSSNAVLDNMIDHREAVRFQAELQDVLARAQRTDVLWTTNLVLHRPPDYLSV